MSAAARELIQDGGDLGTRPSLSHLRHGQNSLKGATAISKAYSGNRKLVTRRIRVYFLS